MYTAEILDAAIRLAQQAGYQVRHEWLGGTGGGGCQFKGRKILFLDLALGPEEQLERVLDSLRRDPVVLAAQIPHPLRGSLGVRKTG
jgi:hypothetical protein